MILHCCLNKKIKYEIINKTDYEIVLRLEQNYKDWKWLHGYQKIVRISPFGKKDKTHTSLCKVSVSKPVEINKININEKDLRIDLFKSTGPGGQHRNKTMSAVRITHLPSKTVVVSCAERSQHDNKRYAMEQLMERLDEKQNKEKKKKKEQIRQYEQNKNDIVLSINYIHGFIINEKKSIKITNIKDVFKGNLDLIKE